MNEHTQEPTASTERVAVSAPPVATEAFPVPPASVPAPWGTPFLAQTSGEELPAAEMDDDPADEPFVPAPRWRPGRLTKVLVCLCLVLAGGLGGAALQKSVDLRTGTTGRAGQFQVGPQNGTGTGGNGGFGGRTRASQSPGTAPSSAPSAP